MNLFPMFVDLRGRQVLVIGGGEVATRKVQALLDAGARVCVHARALAPAMAQWLAQGAIERLDGDFDPHWVAASWLVVAATDDTLLNREVASAAAERHRWVNVVDDAALSSYQVPAVIDRAPLQVAISSAGAAPMLARRLRERLEIELDHSLGPLAALFAQHRPAIRARFPDTAARRRWFDEALDGPVPALMREGDHAGATQWLQTSLEASQDIPSMGSVALVGCDRDDPALLTLRALRVLNQADRVLVDADVSPQVRAMARRDACIEPLRAGEALIVHLQALVARGERVVCLRAGEGFFDAAGRALAASLVEVGMVCENVPPPLRDLLPS
ncbi:MAG TPA: NAD(P)-dependent oxidoreductase [Stenotrophomonas sp.]|jgi:precorrin-2 dehydrogenase/sirohydrochlorin ferrochelatase